MPDKPYYMPLYWNDLLGDNNVRAMTTEDFGAYMLLLGAAWQETPPASLPNNDQILARISGLDPAKWQTRKSVVLAPFKLRDDDRYYQKRLRKVWDEVAESITTNRQRAKTAARARWKKKAPEERAVGGICTREEMRTYAASPEGGGYPYECADWVFDTLEANGWMFGSNPVGNWKAVFRIKASDWRQRQYQQKVKGAGLSDHRSEKGGREYAEPKLKPKLL